MSDILLAPASPVQLPPARLVIQIRPGTEADLDAIDRLQKQHSKQLGFLNRPTLEGKVRLGHVLVACATVESGELIVDREVESGELRVQRKAEPPSSLSTNNSQLSTIAGYLIGNDRYKHRDELGVIFQMCVAPAYRRSLVAANLLKAQFERSAYGCRLYCCWCAQDIEANRFWESMGFVPLAFRTGSIKKGGGWRREGRAKADVGSDRSPSPSRLSPSARMHIFWQKRIRAGDTTTPWWFPSETSGGLMDAARIALPIPPGMTWQDELPRLLPEDSGQSAGDSRQSPDEHAKPVRQPGNRQSKTETRKSTGGLYFGPPKASGPAEKPKRAKPPKKNDPALAAKARELRDRYLEQFNQQAPALPAGKYEVSRTLEARTDVQRIEQAPRESKRLVA